MYIKVPNVLHRNIRLISMWLSVIPYQNPKYSVYINDDVMYVSIFPFWICRQIYSIRNKRTNTQAYKIVISCGACLLVPNCSELVRLNLLH